MRTLILCLFLLPACEWKKDSFRFGELVVISGMEGFTGCKGNVRNYLGFGYYQLDNIWCEYAKPGIVGGKPVSAHVVSEKDMRLLWWQTTCVGGPCYTPVTGTGNIPDIEACRAKTDDSGSYTQLCDYKQYVQTLGRWINAKTGKTAEEEEQVEQKKQMKTGFFKI